MKISHTHAAMHESVNHTLAVMHESVIPMYILGYYKIDIDARIVAFGRFIATWIKPTWDSNQEYVIVRNPKDYNTV